ncbi:hypothetical protein [Brevibacillus fortis]|uniref:hypothetical protein n=1 Tax=Brevibacillus fortis TaxID=2126352 RepID=UPI0038FBE910
MDTDNQQTDMKTYTEDEVNGLIQSAKDEWTNTELEPLQQQIKELEQFKPVQKTDAEIALEQKSKELFEKEKTLTLKEAGLQEFAEFFEVGNIDDLQSKIEQFNKILASKSLDNTYKPESHKTSDKYSIAEKKGDTVSMIGSKMSKIFN